MRYIVTLELVERVEVEVEGESPPEAVEIAKDKNWRADKVTLVSVETIDEYIERRR